jgi:hypothetical protein
MDTPNKSGYNKIPATTGLLIYSALSVYSYNSGKIEASIISLLLAFSSLLYHLNNQNYGLYILDQIFMYIFTFIGFMYASKNGKLIIPILVFFYSAFVFYYGKRVNKYCYHQNQCVARIWHSSIHMVTGSMFAYVL